MAQFRMCELRNAAVEAIRAQDTLFSIFREVDETRFAMEAVPADILLLRELITRRIYPVNAFGLLVRIDLKSAIEALLSRYFGKCVDPDSKFGGFSFEIESMLDDLKEAGGIEAVSLLVQHSEFAADRIEDSRIQRALGEILEIAEEQVVEWVHAEREQKRK